MIIRTKSYPRAALIGNPSDGYYGKTIAFVFNNFSADVVLYESPKLDILSNIYDVSVFNSMEHLVRNISKFGYYGGIRLIKAAIKKFHEYCNSTNIKIDNRNFTVEYGSTIPHSLGLAGSSAIITATMRALMRFFEIEIPKPLLANIVLSVENEELGIPAGLQDRVAQAYEEPVYMDFDKTIMKKQGYGNYSTIKAELFPKMYIAYHTNLSEGSEVLHSNLRERYNRKIPEVLDAIKEWSELSVQVKEKIENGEGTKIASLIDRNFDLRKSIITLSKGNLKMIDIARSVGASAKFTGSGGAIIGTYEDDVMFDVLKVRMNAENIEVIKPRIVITK